MSKWKEEQSELVDHVTIINSKVVLQSSDRDVFLELTFDHLLALIGQSLAVLHGHVLHDGLLKHPKWWLSRNLRLLLGYIRLRLRVISEAWILWLLWLIEVELVRLLRQLRIGVNWINLWLASVRLWQWCIEWACHVWCGCWCRSSHCIDITYTFHLTAGTSCNFKIVILSMRFGRMVFDFSKGRYNDAEI